MCDGQRSRIGGGRAGRGGATGRGDAPVSRGWVRASAPATVANVGCGFDVFGFALERPGDVVAARTSSRPGIVITEITGDGGQLTRDPERNTAGVALARLLREISGERAPGIELRVDKGVPLESGLGSSAASAVAAVVAVDALLDLRAPRELLLTCAAEGERAVASAAHADNAASSLYGGFVLVRDAAPRVVELPVPAGLACAVVRPHAAVASRAARAVLGQHVELHRAVTQWGNTAALVAALFRSDLTLLASALHDEVAEPARAPLAPGLSAMQAAARKTGALGCSLSGSGPSAFALCASLAVARVSAAQMAAALVEATGLASDVYISIVGAPGARLLAEGE